MFASWVNWKIVIWSIVAVCIPIAYIVRSKIFSLKKFFVYVIPATLILHTIAFTVIKDDIIG